MEDQKRVEIIVVGNELLNGTTLDTNSFWLCRELSSIGFKVVKRTTVRDELAVISLTFKQSISTRPHWIFSIGGLGPTYDDMTVQGLALALRKDLKLDSEAVRMLRESFRRRAFLGRPTKRLSATSLKMARIPEGSRPLQNPVGSAPAVLISHENTRIVALPGVPSEMKAIVKKLLVSQLREDSDFIKAEDWLKIVGL